MNHKQLMRIVNQLPSPTSPEDFHYSKEWANGLIDTWVVLKRKQVKGKWDNARFRDALIDEIISMSNGLEEDFNYAMRQAGAPLNKLSYGTYQKLLQAYVSRHRKDVLGLIPTSLHAELCWIPGWDGENLDEMIDLVGQRSERYNSNYIEETVPGGWLIQLLKLANCPSSELRAYCMELGEAGRRFVQATADHRWKVEADPMRPMIIPPQKLVEVIENGYINAAPLAYAEVNVRALFEHDCTKPMLWSTQSGRIFLGLHDGVCNGAGYIDAFDGCVVVPPNESGFAGANRWKWSISEVYGIVKSYAKVTPTEVTQVEAMAAQA